MKLVSAVKQFILLLVGVASTFGNADACFAPPDESTSSPDELVQTADFIVLAEAKTVRGGGGYVDAEFVFETKNILKGGAPYQFKIFGYQRDPADDSFADFDAHKDPAFWGDPIAGNAGITTWCGVFGTFEIGKTYLIIGSETGHFKGYENIRSEDDLWLKVVRLLVQYQSERSKAIDE